MPQLSKIISTSKSDMWAVNQGESVVIIVYVLHLVMQKPSISLKKYNSLFFQCWNFASFAVNIDNRYTSILNALLNVLRNQYLNLWNLVYTCNMCVWSCDCAVVYMPGSRLGPWHTLAWLVPGCHYFQFSFLFIVSIVNKGVISLKD